MPWATILSVALGVVDWLLSRNRDNKEMLELYQKHLEKQQAEYMNSALLRDDAKNLWEKLAQKPFVPSP